MTSSGQSWCWWHWPASLHPGPASCRGSLPQQPPSCLRPTPYCYKLWLPAEQFIKGYWQVKLCLNWSQYTEICQFKIYSSKNFDSMHSSNQSVPLPEACSIWWECPKWRRYVMYLYLASAHRSCVNYVFSYMLQNLPCFFKMVLFASNHECQCSSFCCPHSCCDRIQFFILVVTSNLQLTTEEAP